MHIYIHHPSIQYSIGSSPIGVQCMFDYIFHVSVSCAFLFSSCISSLHHSFTSSSHSSCGLPLVVFPSISPNTTSFTSLLSSIMHRQLDIYINRHIQLYILPSSH